MLSEHLTVVISGSLVTFAAIKIMIFSRGNYSTALAVLNAGQQFTILASTMFSVLVVGAVLFILRPTAFFSTFRAKGTTGVLKQNLRHYVPLLFAWALIIIAAPAYYIAFILTMWLCIKLILRRKPKVKPGQSSKKKKPRLLKLVFISFSANLVLLVISLASSPWAPQENVKFTENGKEVRVSGYMVGQQGKQLLLVGVDRNSLKWLGEDSIRGREVCAVDKNDLLAAKPLLALAGAAISPSSNVEECLASSILPFLN